MSSSSVRTDVNRESALVADYADLSYCRFGFDGRDQEYATTLKISHKRNIMGTNMFVAQGSENAMDIDVCENVSLEGDFGTVDGYGDQVITIKGGCRNVSVRGWIATVTTRRKAHVQIGNWMDQSQRLNSGGVLELYNHADRVGVAIGWAVPFSFKLEGSCKYLLWESIKLKAYWVTKYVVRLVLGIKQGVKGPDWL